MTDTSVMQAKYGVPVVDDIQLKYGVPCVNDEQLKYGVPCVIDEQIKYGVPCVNDIQEKYGVPCVDDIQEKYGVIQQDINITYNQLEDNIVRLKKIISNLRNSWDEQTKSIINEINNSWVGADCAAYTDKLMGMDGKVQRTIESLELLCSTYESARDMVRERQSEVIYSINSIS